MISKKREKEKQTAEKLSKAFTKFNNVLMAHYGLNTTAVLMHLLEVESYFKQQGMLTADGEFFQQHKQISEKFKLSEYQIRKANKQLQKDGLINTKEKVSTFPYRKLYYKIHHDALETLIKSASLKKLKSRPFKNLSHDPLKIKGYNHIKEINRLKNNYIMQKNNLSISLDNTSPNKKLVSPDKFNYIYELYPRKGNRPAAKKAFDELCQKDDRPTYREIRKRIKQHTQADAWQQHIVQIKGKQEDMRPGLTKWIREEMWTIEPSDLPQIYKPKEPDKPVSFGHRDKNPDGSFHKHRKSDITS